MKAKSTLLSVLLTIAIPLVTNAQGITSNLSNNALSSNLAAVSSPVLQTTPVRTIIESSENALTIEYNFSGFNVALSNHNGELFQYLHIHDFNKMGEVGKPALPSHNDMIMVPGGQAEIQIIDAPYHDYPGFNIYPALEDASDEAGTPEPEFIKDATTYSTNAFWPSNIVNLETQQKIRNVDYAVIQIRPVQYNPVTKIIRVYDYIKYRVVFSGSNSEYTQMKYRNTDAFLNSMRTGILNSNLYPSKADNTTKTANSYNILLLTSSTYQQAADTLVKWKRQLGYTVKVIVNNSWTSASVKDTVHANYQNMNPHPDYLLILGNDAAVPAEHIAYSTDYYLSDLYYVCMDGTGDYLADMARGRISVSSAAEAMTVVKKIVDYERNPISDASFYSNIMSCAYFQDGSTYGSYYDGYADRRFLHTAEEIKSYLDAKSYSVSRTYYAFNNRTPAYYNNGYYSDGQAIPSDLLVSNGFNWNGGSADINTKINAGAFLLYHRDHGYIGGYGWEHPYYLNQEASSVVSDGNNINQLTNGSKLPVVFSINCYTGDFRQNESFAENFLRRANGGAVGVFAPSYASYSGYNDALIEGMIDAIWSNPGLIPDFGAGGTVNPALNSHGEMFCMGDVLNQGLLRMVQTWAVATKWKAENEIFHYFGDPTMKIWTANPTTINLSKINTLIRLDSTIAIQTSNCPDASYTLLMGDEMIANGTLSNGYALITLNLDSIHDIVLTIYKHNYRPVVRNIHVDNIIKSLPPVYQASNIRVLDEGAKSTSLTIAWDKGDGDFSLVKISDDGLFTNPNNGVEYSANNVYSGSGEQVVYTGPDNEVTVLNLVSGTVYWFRVYEYNNEGIYTLYQTMNEVDNPNTTDGGSLLPVQLVEFKAQLVDGKVQIEWVTASQVNNDHFRLEKAVNNFDFNLIESVEGNGISNILLTYNFVDPNPQEGVNYYKLIQEDFDGQQTAFGPISINFSGEGNEIIKNVTVTENGIKCWFDGNNEVMQLSVYDITGKLVKQVEIQPNESDIELPIYNISRGLYMISLTSVTQNESRKLFIN